MQPARFDVDPSSSTASQQWSHWYRTFKNFITVVKAKENEKLDLLINYVSPTVYEYISEYTTFKEAIKILDTLYIKPKNEIFARHKLATRHQLTGESVDQYVESLKLLSKDCNFVDVTAAQNRDDFIRDSFINGLLSRHIRQRLLENITLPLKNAINQARSLEMAQRHSESYMAYNPSVSAAYNQNEITDVSPSTSAASVSKCYFCGREKHSRLVCPAKNAVCKKCDKRGHYAVVCKSSSYSNSSYLTSASILAAAPNSLRKAIINININGIKTDALIDTGSSESFINLEFAIANKFRIFPAHGQVSMASTSLSSTVKGACMVNLQLLNHYHNDMKLLVLQGLCADVVIGHDILKQYSSIEISFGGKKSSLSICSLSLALTPYARLFTNLTPDCKPVAVRSRRYSKEDTLFIEKEIQTLLSEGIIEESRSPWRAQVLVTVNENHKKRMVIDYSQTINRFTLLDAYPLPRLEEMVQAVSKYEVFSTIDLRSAYHQIPISAEDKPYTAFEARGRLYQFGRIPFGVTNGVACFQRAIDKIIQSEKLRNTYAYLDDVTVCGQDQKQHDDNLRRFLEVAEKYNLTLNKDKCIFSAKSINLLGYTISNRTIKPDAERLRPLLNFPLPQDSASLRRSVGMFSHYSGWIKNFSEKIRPLIQCKTFPLPSDASSAFEDLKHEVANSVVTSIDNNALFTVETDASDFAIGATLSQLGRPVAFFSRTLSCCEQRHTAVEKEAYAIVEALKKWRHYLVGRHFKLITDQKSVSFMFNNNTANKIKNEKIKRWQLELSCYKYDIIYRPGRENAVADTLSRICSVIDGPANNSLRSLHNSLCHPGITRLYHWVRCKNLPFSLDDIKRITSSCPVCAELKPRFLKLSGKLIKATAPFERLNIDFKGPVPSETRNQYILTIVDEYSRFPFAFPCADMRASTVVKHLRYIFSIFGLPSYIHSDRGTSFISKELKNFLTNHGIATSRTTPYNPQGNGQIERYNGIIWKTITLALRSRNLNISKWETVLQDSLHSIRSLLCTATNTTPHERMFNHQRRSSNGFSLPSWLTTAGSVLMKRPIRSSKYEPLVEEVELIEANPEYAHVRLSDGRETTVSIRQLAPRGEIIQEETITEEAVTQTNETVLNSHPAADSSDLSSETDSRALGRCDRARKSPNYLLDYVTN